MSLDGLSFSTEQSSENLTSKFVPNVLDQILCYTNPADIVNSVSIHDQLRAAACKQLNYRLAAPKRGVFVLRLCVGDELFLLKHNVTLKHPAAVKKTVQRFLRGYESMLLNEVSSSLHLYDGLTTLLIDLTADQHRTLYKIKKRRAAGSRKADENLNSGTGDGYELCVNWKMWSYTINAIVDECFSSLLHLIFKKVDRLMPSQFYVELEFDKLLVDVSNLQTLYMPPIDIYEQAFGGQPGKAWQALHALPEKERLPNLRRLIVDDVQKLISKNSKNVPEKPAFICDLPDFSTACTVLTTDLRKLVSATPIHDTVFLHAADLIEMIPRGLHFYYGHFHLGDGRSRSFLNLYKDMSTFTAKKLVDYVNNVLMYRFSVMNQIMRDDVKQPTFTFTLCMDGPTSDNGFDIFLALCDILGSSTNRQCLQANIRVSIDMGYHDNELFDNWSKLRLLLPAFAVNGTAPNKNTSMPLEVLNCFRLELQMCRTATLKARIDSLKQPLDGTEAVVTVMMAHEYKFPKIRLTIGALRIVFDESGILGATLAADDKRQELVAAWLKSIEDKMMQQITVFACDAVEACRRRDLSFWMYQSLERCEFYFTMQMPAACKPFEVAIGAALQANMERIEQRVRRIVFSVVFDETNCYPEDGAWSANVGTSSSGGKNSVTSPGAFVVTCAPLPALKFVRVKADVEFGLEEEEP